MISILPPIGLNLYPSDRFRPLHALPNPRQDGAPSFHHSHPLWSSPRCTRNIPSHPILAGVLTEARKIDENSAPSSPTPITKSQQILTANPRSCIGKLTRSSPVPPSPCLQSLTSQTPNNTTRLKTVITSCLHHDASGLGNSIPLVEPSPVEQLCKEEVCESGRSVKLITSARPQGPSTPQRGTYAARIGEADAQQPLSPGGIGVQANIHRHSDASSAFIHSIKTASVSNASVSLFPRSSRAARSSDCPSVIRLPRYSTDSDRAISSAIPLEATSVRAMKRKQVIEELITTEESYIADLKALVYLYSTLLASATTIPNGFRVSIQRNVTSILHLHEKMADQMHRTLYRAAARKWADTALPTRVAIRQRPLAFNAESGSRADRGVGPVIGEDLLNARAPKPLQISSGLSEPAEILDIAAIFEENLPSLLLYEEYCANYEMVTHELQKQTSVTWSTYELGIESLVRTLAAVDQKTYQSKKGLTVSDLLIKPIQRICKYPLLLSDLLRHLPLGDGVGAHEAINGVLNQLREVVWSVDVATGSPFTRMQIQRRLRLQEHLNLQAAGIPVDKFRDFGHVHLCGVLHLTYQMQHTICGYYALCAVFDDHFVTALPSRAEGMFDLFAVINLTDLQVQPGNDGKGIQCYSALYTFKLRFMVRGALHEIILSACSPMEEDEWLSALSDPLKLSRPNAPLASSFPTQCYWDLKSLGSGFPPETALTPRSLIQRAATIVDGPAIAQIIIRNTHNPQDLQEFRGPSMTHANRSIPQDPETKVVVLAPKRSERTRLETILSDVWTKDRLPFPGMIGNKGSQILRASAGSLVRKLSFASIQGSFSRRSASITVSSKKSSDVLSEGKDPSSVLSTGPKSFSDRRFPRGQGTNDIPELDTMDNVVGRMIRGGTFGSKRLSFSTANNDTEKKTQVRRRASSYNVGPEDPAAVFYDNEDEVERLVQVVERNEVNRLAGLKKSNESLRKDGRRKRWSNPISKLKELGTEGLKNILHHSK